MEDCTFRQVTASDVQAVNYLLREIEHERAHRVTEGNMWPKTREERNEDLKSHRKAQERLLAVAGYLGINIEDLEVQR